MKIIEKYLNVIVFICLIIIWQISSVIFVIPEYILPSPLLILQAIIENFQILLIHSAVTLSEAICGMLIAIVLGILMASLLFKSKMFERLLVPYISVLQTIPAIAIAPLFAMWFGFGFFPKILLIVIFCSFPIIISTLSGFKQVDYEHVVYLKSLGASPTQRFIHLYLPAASGSIFSSIKISMTYALVNAIFAEYMGAKYGLGVFLNRASSSFNTANVFATIVIIVVVTLSLLKVVEICEKKIIKWG